MSTRAPSAVPGLGVRRSLGAGPGLRQRIEARALALRALDHAAVLAPTSIDQGDGGEVVATFPRVPGVDLAELARRRQPLALGECVWVGLRVGEALEAMHAAGVVHGDIAPANIAVTDGTLTLLDTIAGCLTTEHGTVGFRAPERPDGATAPGDVYAWGLLLRWCASDDARHRIEAWTAPMVSTDPSDRPPAQVAARALRTCARAVPVAMPGADDVIAASRSRALEKTERIAAGRRWRVRRWVLRAAGAVAIAGCAASIVVGVPRAVDAALPVRDGPVSTSGGAGAEPRTEAVPGPDHRDAATAAAHATIARAAALEAEDPEALREVRARGDVRDELETVAGRIAAGHLTYDGLTIEVLNARVSTASDRAATVDLDYAVSGHAVVDGPHRIDVAPFEQRVSMALEWDDEWWVVGVSPRE